MLSCLERKSAQKENKSNDAISLTNIDTLNFTSAIRSILQDRDGNYWIGSHQEGVCFYDGKTYRYYTKNDGLPDNQIRSIQEDKHGNIWLGTANGICSYNGEKFTIHTPQTFNVNSGVENTSDYLWFGAGIQFGVYQFDGKMLNYLPFKPLKKDNINDSYSVTAISKNVEGKVWIATYAALFQFDGSKINPIDKSKLAIKEKEYLHIRSILADSKGRTWIGNNGIGVLLYNGDSTINFSEAKGLIHPNSSRNGKHSPAGTLEHVFAITEDSLGNIWFGDRDTGAWRYDGRTMTNYSIDEQLNSPMIWDIYEDHNKDLLFAMQAGGVYKFNGKSFERKF